MSDIAIKWTSDIRDLERDNEKLRKGMTRLEEKLAGVGDKSRKHHRRAIADSETWMDRVQKLAIGYIGVSKAIGVAKQALDDMERTRQTAAQRQREATFPIGQLKELAAVSAHPQQRYNELVQKTLAFQREAGIPLGESAQNVFSVVSAGSEQDLEFYAKLAGSRMTREPGEVAKQVAAIKTAMPGRFKRDEEVISMMLGMSGKTRTTVPELMEATARGAGTAGMIGLDPAEHAAAVTLMSKVLGPERAGTYVAQMERTFFERGIKGKSLEEIVQKTPELALERQMDKTRRAQAKRELEQQMRIVQAGGEIDPELLKRYMGRAQGMQALQLIQLQPELFREIKQAGVEGRQQNVVRRGMELRNRRIDTAIEMERSQAEREQSEIDLAISENRFETVMNRMAAEGREEGESEAKIWAREKIHRGVRWASWGTDVTGPSLLGSARGNDLGRLVEVTEKVEENTRNAANNNNRAAAELQANQHGE